MTVVGEVLGCELTIDGTDAEAGAFTALDSNGFHGPLTEEVIVTVRDALLKWKLENVHTRSPSVVFTIRTSVEIVPQGP